MSTRATPSPAPSHGRRLPALAHLFAWARVRESFRMNRAVSLRSAAAAGLQVAGAVAIALALTHLSPWPRLQGFAAMGALATAFGQFSTGAARLGVVARAALLMLVSVASITLAAWAGLPPVGLLVGVAIVCGVMSVAVRQWQLIGPGGVVFAFGASGAMAPAASLSIALAQILMVALGGGLALLVCLCTDRFRMPPPAPPMPSRHSSPGRCLVAATRITVCAATAALLAHAWGWPHAAWAALGATAVMQGAHLHVHMHRAVQRMAGTVAGALLASLFFAAEPSFWGILLAVMLFQLLAEMLIGINYALALAAVTPMALLMTALGSPDTVAAMPMARVLDTLLGAGVGVGFAWLFSSMDERAALATHHAAATQPAGGSGRR